MSVERPAIPVSEPTDARLDPHRPEFAEYPYLPLDLAGTNIASWTARIGGPPWLDGVVGLPASAVQIRASGYPSIYTVRGGDLPVELDPHQARSNTVEGGPVDLTKLAAVPPDEWLLVTVWDQS